MKKFIIDDRIFTVKFSCDVNKCKGACCTLKGAGGAPLLEEEVKIVKRNIEKAKKYLTDEHISALNEYGFYEKSNTDYTLNSVNDKECVFAYYENGIANCSFQKAFLEGESDFIKPVSCHLFPVRIHGLKRNIMKYESIYECEDALDKGIMENTTIFEFAKEALIREYGSKLYIELKNKYLNNY
ncbi:MAG: hypothetical protein HGGPFJEG_01830 [Ignavibacteria bacterium]|nr:hypothetical protein [Ignavibacteria bacterium]